LIHDGAVGDLDERRDQDTQTDVEIVFVRASPRGSHVCAAVERWEFRRARCDAPNQW